MFFQSFEDGSIVCSDSWSDSCLVVGPTTGGVYLLDEALPWDVKCLLDKSVQVKQLDICELNNIMILLISSNNNCNTTTNDSIIDETTLQNEQMTSTPADTDSLQSNSGGGRLCVFNLNDFNQSNEIINSNDNKSSENVNELNLEAMNKNDCKERRLDFMPTFCHVYAISKQIAASQLKIVAACGKKLFVIKLKDIHYNNAASSDGAATASSCISNLNNAAITIAVNPILGLSSVTRQKSTKQLPAPLKKGHSAASFMNKCKENNQSVSSKYNNNNRQNKKKEGVNGVISASSFYLKNVFIFYF